MKWRKSSFTDIFTSLSRWLIQKICNYARTTTSNPFDMKLKHYLAFLLFLRILHWVEINEDFKRFNGNVGEKLWSNKKRYWRHTSSSSSSSFIKCLFFLLVRETSTATSFAPDANYQTHFSIIKYRSAHAYAIRRGIASWRRKRFFDLKLTFFV